eukprot:scaffold104330_cov21-Tisochrysis_lutea.AAC.1
MMNCDALLRGPFKLHHRDQARGELGHSDAPAWMQAVSSKASQVVSLRRLPSWLTQGKYITTRVCCGQNVLQQSSSHEQHAKSSLAANSTALAKKESGQHSRMCAISVCVLQTLASLVHSLVWAKPVNLL